MKAVSKSLKKLIILFCTILPVFVVAQNEQQRSDVTWVTLPNNTNWLYKTGEKASLEVQLFKYGIVQDELHINYEIGGDMMPADTKGSVVIKNGKATIPLGTMKTPGFRDCRMTAMIEGKQYRYHTKVGFSPENIIPYTAMPSDFSLFWEQNINEASKFPLQYTKKKVEAYSTEKIDCYLVKLQLNKQGQAIYGYLFYPKGATEKSHPVVLCPPGAGIKTIKEPMRSKYYPEQGFIRFEIEIHGLNPELSAEDFSEISAAFNGKENGYLNNGLDNKDNYYMKRVYLACVRALDLLTSLPEWDGKNVAVQGGSQGGALALIAAGLDKRVTACVANHPALSDMAGYLANRAGGYPHFFRTAGMDTPEKLNTMAYYDVVNFARLIKVPTYLTWGYNDDVCPPTTSYAVYNVLQGPKEALITPINEHWTSEATQYNQMLWIKSNLR